jgi:hypothetical protein
MVGKDYREHFPCRPEPIMRAWRLDETMYDVLDYEKGPLCIIAPT